MVLGSYEAWTFSISIEISTNSECTPVYSVLTPVIVLVSHQMAFFRIPFL